MGISEELVKNIEILGLQPMTEEPHVIAIVGNDITFDSRVKKAAMTAANAGYKTTIICYSPTPNLSLIHI